MTIEDGQLDKLSDDDAIALLYELANNGENSSSEFTQLESMVYERLLQTYNVTAQDRAPVVSQTESPPYLATSVTSVVDSMQPAGRPMDIAAAA